MASRFSKIPTTVDRPKWLTADKICYETLMGSQAYGVAGSDSDIDLYGFCVPPVELVFPHLNGEIIGFGEQVQRFEQFQSHGWLDDDGKENDIQIYSIVRYFQLCMENNPNMIDSLYTPDYCVTQMNAIGRRVRERRDIFLHKGAWHKFKGYAYSQLNKIRHKNPEGRPQIEAVLEIEDQLGIDHKTAFADVEAEMKRRHLL